MDILDRLLGHDADATRQLLLLCGSLPDDVLDQRFEFGQETLRRTFVHIIENMEIWTQHISESNSRPVAGVQSICGLIERLDLAAAEFAAAARKLRDENKLDDYFIDTYSSPPKRKTFGGAIVHLATHSMHHRAQIMVMLELLGIAHEIEGDALGWERRLRGGWETV